MADQRSALAYKEPAIVELLVLASFLLTLNAVDYALNHLLFCGLVGQILIGVAWGTPGANLLSESIQDAVMQFGYLGLIMIVYEGGLAINLRGLRADLSLSTIVALVGISFPIALSFTLQGLLDASPIQAFAAGASLCSTSLGTTFTILSTSGLSQTRIGIVLTSAAMIDDVVGLVMSGVIARLGSASTSFSAITVIRPIFVSLAYAALLPIICVFVVKPVALHLRPAVNVRRNSRVARCLMHERTALILHIALLVGLVASSSYAGTSNLFAAYLAGATITWWDGFVSNDECRTADRVDEQSGAQSSQPAMSSRNPEDDNKQDRKTVEQDGSHESESKDNNLQETTGISTENCSEDLHSINGRSVYERYFAPATEYILKPFFFASIGFAIPISQLFSAQVVWRGFVYAILMVFAKLVCGLCLVRFSSPVSLAQWLRMVKSALHWSSLRRLLLCTRRGITSSTQENGAARAPSARDSQANNRQISASGEQTWRRSDHATSAARPLSLYPAALLGSAMVARGEIGFLISSIAASDGIFDNSSSTGNSEVFLVTTWAILICTFAGPIAVGTLTRRIRRLQRQERQNETGREDPLGVWGIARPSV